MRNSLVILGTLAALISGACAINPATGRQQLSLISESQEIRLGQGADRDVQASMGLYRDATLEQEVESTGQRLAALSERPDLPWSFHIVDDPAINAFALPGGFIYLTRGILARFQSEAEMAAVVGHEIGHVTARHSVNQMSKAQLAGLGLGLGAALDPEIARFSGLAESGLGLLFLKFGRDDERQADDLGLRYMQRGGYPGGAMVDMFRMLGASSDAGGGSAVPGWLSTHPSPENREGRIQAQLPAGTPAAAPSERYLRLLEGLVYGEDPRQGYFEGEVFRHPHMAFRIDFPTGWTTVNTRSAVGGRDAAGEAAMQLTLAREATPAAAATRFFGQAGIERGAAWRDAIGGLPTVTARFRVAGSSGEILGLAAFVALGDRVFQLLGYGTATAFPQHEAELAPALASFRRLSERAALEVQPRRLAITRLEKAQSLAELQSRQPSTVPMSELALLNRVEPGQRLAAGTLVKRVIGGP